MSSKASVPELLAPAGSLDSVRAAIANGADSIYLGAGRFNARDDGAQLSMNELETACRLAHERGRRVYLTLNTLVKPSELREALHFLAAAVEFGIDAVIVQDMGLVALISKLFPTLEIHGSTQMTVHDGSTAALMLALRVHRVVLARENTLDDIASIRDAAPELGLETFVHGALCISYSGQCYMSGMISERSANRGSCAQSCRKDYRLIDARSSEVLDRGYLISARDLAAAEHLGRISELGVQCLKIEGRKKKPEYVATVTRGYRTFLDRMSRGETSTVTEADLQPLVQIFSRGFTGGMYGGREGRGYVTRTQPDNLGEVLGLVVGHTPDGLIVEVSQQVKAGDGLGFHAPDSGESRGFSVARVRTLSSSGAPSRQLIHTRERIPIGWRVVRSSHAELLDRARQSYARMPATARASRERLDARVSGRDGSPLTLEVTGNGRTVRVASISVLGQASKHALNERFLREHLGRLGNTPFVLGALDCSGLADGLFIAVSELNHLRQRATDQLLDMRREATVALRAELGGRIEAVVADVNVGTGSRAPEGDRPFQLIAEVYSVPDAVLAADAGATEIVIDPFLRHPTPPLARVRALSERLAATGTLLRLRTPTIVRPSDRGRVERWLEEPLPVLTGHPGLLAELAREGRDVAADYAVNCFNQHTAALLFGLGASSVTLSVELTAGEMEQVVLPWGGRGFQAVLYGRPEGMTIEHCVLSAAFDRAPTTCRDLCVKLHPEVTLEDPLGYPFPVATDSDCRNRLLHSRPIEGSEFAPHLWAAGIRSFRLLLNVPGLPVGELVASYRALIDSLCSGARPDTGAVRRLRGAEFTRGHFARAV